MVKPTFVGAITFATSAGVATFFAPCAFLLLPGNIGYYPGESGNDMGMIAPAIAAAGGTLSALAVIALLVVIVGLPIKTTLPIFNPVVGGWLTASGIITILNWGPKLHPQLPKRPASKTGFGVFGAMYAVAAAGCVVPLLFGVVTQALALPVYSSALVLVAYVPGMMLPLVE